MPTPKSELALGVRRYSALQAARGGPCTGRRQRVTPDPARWSALATCADHIKKAHPKIREVRCYRFNGGTEIMWQEGFENFHDYQDLIAEDDDICEKVMGAVFQHMVSGTQEGRIWSDAL
jgi:hypothetical protein